MKPVRVFRAIHARTVYRRAAGTGSLTRREICIASPQRLIRDYHRLRSRSNDYLFLLRLYRVVHAHSLDAEKPIRGFCEAL